MRKSREKIGRSNYLTLRSQIPSSFREGNLSRRNHTNHLPTTVYMKQRITQTPKFKPIEKEKGESLQTETTTSETHLLRYSRRESKSVNIQNRAHSLPMLPSLTFHSPGGRVEIDARADHAKYF